MAADIIPRSRLSEGLGVFGLYGTIAGAIAPGIALSIIGDGKSNDLFTPLFILSAVIAAVCMVLDGLIRYERKAKTTGKDTPSAAQEGEPSCDELLPKTFFGFESGIILPSIMLICLFVAVSSVSSFLTLFAQERVLGNIGLYFTLSAVGMFLSRSLLGKVADRHGWDIILIPAFVVFFLCFAVIPFIYNAVWLFVIAVPLGLAQGAICPVANTMLIRRCTPRRRGTAAAAYFSSIDIGLGFGALMFGIIDEYLGFNLLFWIAALFAAVAAVIYLTSLTNKKCEKTFLS